MRSLIVALWVCSAVAAATAAEQQFPYKAYINTDEVYVRSGPGQNYYPTDKLRVGQEVEVYRHDPGGWYAIRPVDGSYSWINTRFVEPKGDGLATIGSEDVAARVGSRFSDVRDVIQVRLHHGEVVALLDEKEVRRGTNPWCKIAPPAGEFRWVSGKYVDAEYPHDGLRKTESDHRPHHHDADQPPPPPPAAAAVARLSPTDFKNEVDAIDLELGVMLAEEPSVWSFDSARRRTELLLEQADTAVERGHARVLLNKIDRFAGIKDRYDSVNAVREETARANRLLAGVDRTARAELPPPDNLGRFDGTGRLTEVVSAKPGGPRYALVDDHGQVRCYVTPAPGVNLRYYVGQRVGISGTRGYIPEQRAQHLMARHISPLDGTVLR